MECGWKTRWGQNDGLWEVDKLGPERYSVERGWKTSKSQNDGGWEEYKMGAERQEVICLNLSG